MVIVFALRHRAGENFIRPISARYMHAKDIANYEEEAARLDSDEAAEKFIATVDLSEYDLSGMEMVRFEFQPKTERMNMRLPRPPLDAVKASAATARMPYPRFIRQALETAVQQKKAP